MPESSKARAWGFCAVASLGLALLIYFAHSAGMQSVPDYSTLSTGPGGAKLLYDSLAQTGPATVTRQYKDLSLERPKNAVIFFLGFRPWIWSFVESSYFDNVENTAKNGNTIVFCSERTSELPAPKLKERWGIQYQAPKKSTSSDADDSAMLDLDKNWIALPDIAPGVWQRRFGSGRILLVLDASRLNNKAIATKEDSRLLLQRLTAGYSSIVFEEAHLGINETGSIAGLARHYHLQGLVAGLILLAALFVWSRSVAFPPAPPPAEEPLLGTDSRSMLAELMHRHLKSDLIATCVAQWNRTCGHAAALESPPDTNPVAAYSSLQETLRKRSKLTL